MPNTIFPPKSKSTAVPNNSAGKKAKTESEANSNDALQSELFLLQTAKEEIALWQSNEAENRLLEIENQVEVEKSDEKTDGNKPKSSLSSVASERISDPKSVGESATKVLEMLKLPDNPRVELVMQRIDKRVEQLTEQVFKSVQTEKTIVVYGGAIWERSALPPQTRIPNPLPDDSINSSIANNKLTCFVRPLGVADFHRVEQELCRYVPGEISYIENILRGEDKLRTTRNLLRAENTFTYSQETEKEDIRDTQTTDRFEIEKETSNMINEQLAVSANLTVMGTYGAASFTANTGLSSNTAIEESNRNVVKSGKEVTEQVRQRTLTRVKEERVTKILKEYEEINAHTLKGGADENTVGVYRWLDKIYLATLRNYGKRLTFEFNIPEPAAFHLWAMTDNKDNITNSVTITQPIKPTLTSFSDITTANYKGFAAVSGVNVDLPPENIYVSHVFNGTGDWGDSRAETNLNIPAGYESYYIQSYANVRGTVTITAATQWLDRPPATDYARAYITGITGSFPVSIFTSHHSYSIHILLQCVPTATKMDGWRQSVFNAIMNAYQQKLAEYNQALEEAKIIARNDRRSGTNPLMNEQIVRSELKKLCIYSFVHSAFFTDDTSSNYDTESVTDMSFWNIWSGADGFPMYSLGCDKRDKFRRERMRFLEDAFDWDLLVSEFLPYYYAYGKSAHWKQLYQLTDTDPLFLNFLQAGLARVRVPVKVGMEAAALRFWETEGQEIPRGSEVYHFENDYIQHLYADIQAPIKDIMVLDPADGASAQDLNHWTIRVPTTLTILQKASEGIDQNDYLCSCGDRGRTKPTMPWL